MEAHKHTYMGAYGPATWMDRGGKQCCSWCGSMHPSDLAAALRAGEASGHWADFKYGWPHKWYVDGVPGSIKFYTEHLQDATPEDREVIEKAMGLRFTFEGDGVRWAPATAA